MELAIIVSAIAFVICVAPIVIKEKAYQSKLTPEQREQEQKDMAEY